MFESLKVANMLQKHQTGQPGAGWTEAPAMLFSENAAIASDCFGRPVGKLIPGAYADVIVVDYDPPLPCTARISPAIFSSASRTICRYHDHRRENCDGR